MLTPGDNRCAFQAPAVGLSPGLRFAHPGLQSVRLPGASGRAYNGLVSAIRIVSVAFSRAELDELREFVESVIDGFTDVFVNVEAIARVSGTNALVPLTRATDSQTFS